MHLTGQESVSTNELRIFRKHNNRLDISGDLSFPLNLSGWKKYEENDRNTENIKIVSYIHKFNKNELIESDFETLIEETKTWNTLFINKIKLHENKVNIFLNRETAFNITINNILTEKEHYGSFNLKIKPIVVHIDDTCEKSTDLTSLRLKLLKNVIDNIFKNVTNTVTSDGSDTIYLTTKSISNCKDKKIICGVVINNKFGKKNTNISAEQFYK